MTLKTKRPCWGCSEPMLELHPLYKQYPNLCPWCYGEKEIEVSVSFYEFPGDFKTVDWNNTQYNKEDLYAELKCQCGDEIHFNESEEIVACSCGRVYKLSVSVNVNETYLDNQDGLREIYKEQ